MLKWQPCLHYNATLPNLFFFCLHTAKYIIYFFYGDFTCLLNHRIHRRETRFWRSTVNYERDSKYNKKYFCLSNCNSAVFIYVFLVSGWVFILTRVNKKFNFCVKLLITIIIKKICMSRSSYFDIVIFRNYIHCNRKSPTFLLIRKYLRIFKMFIE